MGKLHYGIHAGSIWSRELDTIDIASENEAKNKISELENIIIQWGTKYGLLIMKKRQRVNLLKYIREIVIIDGVDRLNSIIKNIAAKCKAAKIEIDNPRKYRVRHVFKEGELDEFKCKDYQNEKRKKRKCGLLF